MRLFYKTALTIFFAASAAISAPALAASLAPLKTAIQDVRESINELADVKDSSDDSQKENKKIAAGKDTLRKIIALGEAEALALKNKLKELEIEQLVAADFNFDAEGIHQNLSQMLSYFDAYYESAGKRTDNLTTYEEIRVLAQDIRVWRERVYTPGSQKILSLDLALKNKMILKIGNARFDKIVLDLKKLRNAKLISNAAIEPLLNSALGSRRIAIALDEEITEIILKMLNEYPVILGESKTNGSVHIIPDYRRIENLVGQSFEQIREMYKKFLEINNLVKKMLAG